MSHSNQQRPYVFGPRETLQSNDIVIAAMSTTDTGKTTFINNFADAQLPLDDSLRSACTGEVRKRQTTSPEVTSMPPPSRDPYDSSETVPSVHDHDLTGEDTIVALMGPSGTGKSSFINKLMGQSVAVVNDSVDSCTQEVQAFTCYHPDGSGREVIIIDTPGFDDSRRSDYEILDMITQWLTKTFKRRIMLTGIIQFCSIADTRMRGTPLKNLKIFEQLCGPDALKNVILTTTFWDQVNADVGLLREAQLKSEFWADMIAHGCHVARFNPQTYQSAWEIIHMFDTIVSQPQPLRVQTEMVDEGKALHDTSAFKTLSNWLAGVVEKVKRKASRSRSGKISHKKELPTQRFSRRD